MYTFLLLIYAPILRTPRCSVLLSRPIFACLMLSGPKMDPSEWQAEVRAIQTTTSWTPELTQVHVAGIPRNKDQSAAVILFFSIIVWRVQGSVPKFEKLWRIRFQSTNNSVVNFRLKNRFQKCEQETIQVLFPILMHLCTFKIWQSTGKCFHICCSFCHFRSSTSRSLEGSFYHLKSVDFLETRWDFPCLLQFNHPM